MGGSTDTYSLNEVAQKLGLSENNKLRYWIVSMRKDFKLAVKGWVFYE